MYTTEIGTDLARAKQLLEEGELVAIPTETVYGLAGNGLNSKAIAKIYVAKIVLNSTLWFCMLQIFLN